MSLVLAIETAAPEPVVALGDASGVLWQDTPEGRMEGPVFLRRAVREALAASGRSKSDIAAVAVDLGPGGLTATRSGVTFANALAWGLRKPLVALGYFDLVGRETARATGRVAACVRPTTEGDAFMALHDGKDLGALRFGNLEQLTALAHQDADAPVAAGVVTQAVEALFADRDGVRVPSAETLVSRALELLSAGTVSPDPLEPVTNQSPGVIVIEPGVSHV